MAAVLGIDCERGRTLPTSLWRIVTLLIELQADAIESIDQSAGQFRPPA